MATQALVESDREIGEAAAKALFGYQKLRPMAVLWFYDDSSEEWRLMVAADVERRLGPRGTYALIRDALGNAGLLNALPLRRVIATSPRNPIIQVLKRFAANARHLAISNCIIDGIPITSVYLYAIH